MIKTKVFSMPKIHRFSSMIKKRFSGKRAQGEQFNWIFVIIAGAVILAFFGVFTMKYIQLQQLQQNIDIGRNFKQSIDILQNSPIVGKERGVSIDDNSKADEGAFRIGVVAEMEYYCDVASHAQISFNGEDRYPIAFEKEILFGPSKMKINSLDLWVLPYYFPFFVTNVVYLSDPRADYFFVYDSGKNEEIVKNMYTPSNLNVEKVSVSSKLKADSGTVGRFVFFTADEKSATSRIKDLAKMYDEVDVKHVKINAQDEEIGTVTFFDNMAKSTGKVNFYGRPLMWGAIFSSDSETYNCAANKTIKRIPGISDIYSTKANLLAKTEPSECSVFYSAFRTTLNGYGGKTFTKDGYKQRFSIDLQDNDLAGKGCQYVY